MDVLQKLGAALGFATLAGLNLYLTVFATSLAIYNGWIVLSPEYQQLAVLGHPAVIVASGILYALEFFADKVPWVDSLWDSVHTVIRPLGGAFLALKVLGTPDPTYNIVVALLAGGVALTTHGAKAGTRLIVNASPEPFSNIAVSLGEDVAVAGGLGLMAYSYRHNPYLSLIVFGAFLGILLFVTPKVLRFGRIKIWLLWKKLSSPAADAQSAALSAALPSDADILLGRPAGSAIAWAAPCLTGSSKGGLPANFSGHLVALDEGTPRLWFVGRRGWRSLRRELDVADYRVAYEPRFLSEDLALYHPGKGAKYLFVFDRSKAGLVRAVARTLEARLAVAAPVADPAPAAA